MSYTQNERKQRIIKIMNSIEKAQRQGKEIEPEKLIAVIMAEYGCERRKAKEYLGEASWLVANHEPLDEWERDLGEIKKEDLTFNETKNAE